MGKVMKQFRLEEATVQNLDRMATAMGLNLTEVVEQALAQLARPTLSKRIDAVYQMVNAQISDLEIIRDYDEGGLSESEQVFYNWLNQAWGQLRDLPGFWEPRFLETDLNDYVLDATGQPVPDPDHEMTRPEDL